MFKYLNPPRSCIASTSHLPGPAIANQSVSSIATSCVVSEPSGEIHIEDYEYESPIYWFAPAMLSTTKLTMPAMFLL